LPISRRALDAICIVGAAVPNLSMKFRCLTAVPRLRRRGARHADYLRHYSADSQGTLLNGGDGPTTGEIVRPPHEAWRSSVRTQKKKKKKTNKKIHIERRGTGRSGRGKSRRSCVVEVNVTPAVDREARW